MADRTATFAIEIEDDGATSTALKVADALEALKKRMLAGTENLRAMQTALRNLKGASVVNVEATKKLTDGIAAQKAAIASAQEKYLNLGGSLKGLTDKSKASAGGVKGLLSSLASSGGPLGSMAGGLQKVVGFLGGGLTLGIVAAAAAIVVLVAAIGAAVVAFGALGVSQANAARSERLMLEGMTKIPNWFGIAAGSAKELQDSIDGVASSVALGRDKVAGYAQELYKSGLRGRNLTDAVEATSIAVSAAGEAYGGMVKSMFQGSAYAGQSVQKLADQVKNRFGGVAKAQLLDLDVQTKKLKEGFDSLFRGVKIEGFLSALKAVTDLFSQNTQSGQALKVIVETLFDPLGKALAAVAPIAKRFFQGLVIGTLDVLIAVQELRLWFKNTFGDVSLFKGIDFGTVALLAARIAIYGVAAAFGVVAISLATVIAPWAILIGFVYYLGLGFLKLGEWIAWLFGQFDQFEAWADSFAKSGADMVKGFVQGIIGGYKWIVDAVSGLGDVAIKALKSVLLMHSPSKVFEDLGGFTAEGYIVGVEKSSPSVADAMQQMVDVPTPSRGGQVDSRDTRSASAKIEIRELHYHSSGKANHEDDAEDFRSKLERTLLGLAIHMGAPT